VTQSIAHNGPIPGVPPYNSQIGVAQSNSFPNGQIPIMISGMSPQLFNNGLFDADKRPLKTDEELGQEVLATVEAHQTEMLGQLAKAIREKLTFLDTTASFTSEQWKAFAELTNSIKEMIGQ